MASGKPNPQLVSALFSEWNDRGIDYVVPRNYEGFPADVGKDLDIIVRHSHIDTLINAALAVFDRGGYECPDVRRARRGCSIVGTPSSQAGKDPLKHAPIEIDAGTYVAFHFGKHRFPGINYKVFAEDFAKRPYSTGDCKFFILKPRDQFIALFRQWGFKKKDEYRRRLEQLLSDSAELEAWFSEVAGLPSNTNPVSLPKPDTEAYRSVLRKLSEHRWGPQSLLRLALTHIRVFVFHRPRTVFRLPPLIYFTGPDGSGKTTLVEHLKTYLEGRGIRYAYFYSLKKVLRFMTRYLKWLTKVKRSGRKGAGIVRSVELRSEDERDRDDGTGYWRFRKYISLLVGIVDIFLGYALAMLCRLRGQVVLVETSPYDIFVKYHMPKFSLTERIVTPLLPKPSLGILLVASPERIHARKPELTVEELDEYYGRMHDILLYGGVSRVYVHLDTDSHVENACLRIEREFSCLYEHSRRAVRIGA